jgi:hypothetical protein
MYGLQVVGAIVNDDRRPDIPPPAELAGTLKYHDEYVKLICDCWVRDPALRPTFAAVIVRLRCELDGIVVNSTASWTFLT